MRSWMRDLRRASGRRSGTRAACALAIVAGVLALAGSGGIASADTGGAAIGYGSTWAYISGTPESPPAENWFSQNYTPSGWSAAAGPFSNTSQVYCSTHFDDKYGLAGLPTTANTDFPLYGTLYLRQTFSLPAYAWGLHVVGTIDNTASVWVNGSSYGSASGGRCSTGDINFDVPSADLNRGGTTNLAAVEASDSGVATYFALQATYGAIAFANQAAETQQGSPITDAGGNPIQVTITPPAGGKPVPVGTPVTISLQTISGSGAISGYTATTDASGVATFPNLEISAPGEYRLVATSEGATVTSNAFLIADQVTDCPAGQTCTSTGGSTSDTQVIATSSFTSDPQLAVSVIDGGAGIPGNVCDNFVPQGAGSFINILGGGGGNITATWTLAKSLVLASGDPGAAHFDICLGAENLEGGTTPWTTKDGSPATAVYDSNLGVTLYWGLLPDCPKKGTATGPCILHRNKNHGNEVVSFYLPYPWDASFHGG